MRAEAGYFAGILARATHDARIGFAIGARRIAPLWRLLAGIAADDWHDATDLGNAQVGRAVLPGLVTGEHPAADRPGAAGPGPGLRRPEVTAAPHPAPGPACPADPRTGRRRAIYAYSFILTNLDVSAPDKAAAVEHWHRHRTTVENNLPRQQARRCAVAPPQRIPQVNLAWMWGALLAANMAVWLHQLTAPITAGEDILAGHGVRGDKAMIATLR